MNWTDLWAQTAFASVISDLSRSPEISIEDILAGVPEFTRYSDAAVFHSGNHYLFSDETHPYTRQYPPRLLASYLHTTGGDTN